jgi:hypothetical protein
VAEFGHLVQSELVTIPRHVRHLEIQLSSYQHISDNARLWSQLTFIKDLYLDRIDFRGRIGSLGRGFRYFRSLTQLRIFCCDFNSFNDLANVLRSCIMLEDLSLVQVMWSPASESVPVAGSLPSLRNLDIRFVSYPEDVSAWLLFLQPVPALHSFTFHPHTRMANSGYHLQLNTFLKTVGPSLQHLDVDDAVSCSCTLLTI